MGLTSSRGATVSGTLSARTASRPTIFPSTTLTSEISLSVDLGCP